MRKSVPFITFKFTDHILLIKIIIGHSLAPSQTFFSLVFIGLSNEIRICLFATVGLFKVPMKVRNNCCPVALISINSLRRYANTVNRNHFTWIFSVISVKYHRKTTNENERKKNVSIILLFMSKYVQKSIKHV